MIKIYLASFVSVFIVSLVSLSGIFVFYLQKKLLKNILLYLVSFAVGALLGNAFLHLLPEAFDKLGSTASLLTLTGMIIFFVLEKFLRWRHCHLADCREHKTHLTTLNLVSDGVHNFIDGMIIAASYTINISLGLTTTLAILAHEVPQEIGDFGILLHGGFSFRKALFYNFLSAGTAFLGVIVLLLIGPGIENLTFWLLPIAAGGFIYLAMADLVPELHREIKMKNSLIQLLFLILGILIMVIM